MRSLAVCRSASQTSIASRPFGFAPLGFTPTRLFESIGQTRLDLGNCGIGDVGAKALAKSPYLTRLTHLDLWSTRRGLRNAIGNEGAQALAAAPQLDGLEWLQLRGNPLGSAGIKALRERFGERFIFREDD